MRIALLLVSAGFCALATDFEPPIIGYFFDAKTQRIRTLAGTPGAAMIGPPVSEELVEKALVSDDATFAIVATPGSEHLGYLRPRTGELSFIEGAPRTFEAGALSPSSAAAAIYAESCRCVIVLASLRSTPVLSRTVPIPEGAEVRALAVTDDGSAVAIASADRVWVDGLPFEMPASATALAFRQDGTQLAIADSARKSVTVVVDLAGAQTIHDLLTEQDGIASPAGVRFVGATAVLAADAGGGVRVIDVETRTIRSVDCPCKPALAEPTATPRFVRISGSEDGAVWIVDTAEENLRALFIPEQAQ